MGQAIQENAERLQSRERQGKNNWCERENAEAYDQLRGGGGMTLEEHMMESDPVRLRHLRGHDEAPPTPMPPVVRRDPVGNQPGKDNHEGEERHGHAEYMRTMDDKELKGTIWRLPSGSIGNLNLGDLDTELHSRDKALSMIPTAMVLTEPARLQMELIGTVVANKSRGYVRALLGQCSNGKNKLTREQLRRAFRMLNVDPHEELLDHLMGGKKWIHDMDVARSIEGDIASKDYEAPLGDPQLATPFGVAQDAVKGVEENHDRLNTKWGSLEQAFGNMDVDGSGNLSFEEFKVALQNACPVNLSEKELQGLFVEVDKDHSGEVNYEEFQQEFGQGSIFVPEFLKPRSLRQSRGGPIWRWNIQCQGSNSKRPFEITDKYGHKRYHCKASHSYKLAKAFTEDAIARKIHLCREEMEKIESVELEKQAQEKIEYDKHFSARSKKGLAAPPPRSRPQSGMAEVDKCRAIRPPWAVNPSLGTNNTYSFRVNGTVPSN